MAEALLSFQSCPAACTADAGRLKAAKNLISQSKKTLPCGFCVRKSERFQQKLVGVAVAGGTRSPVRQLVKDFFDELSTAGRQWLCFSGGSGMICAIPFRTRETVCAVRHADSILLHFRRSRQAAFLLRFLYKKEIFSPSRNPGGVQVHSGSR